MKHLLKARWDKIKSNKKIFYSVLGGVGTVVTATAITVPVAVVKHNDFNKQKVDTQPDVSSEQIKDDSSRAPSVEEVEMQRMEEAKALYSQVDKINPIKLLFPSNVLKPLWRENNYATAVVPVDYVLSAKISKVDEATGVQVTLDSCSFENEGSKINFTFSFKKGSAEVEKHDELDGFLTLRKECILRYKSQVWLPGFKELDNVKGNDELTSGIYANMNNLITNIELIKKTPVDNLKEVTNRLISENRQPSLELKAKYDEFIKTKTSS